MSSPTIDRTVWECIRQLPGRQEYKLLSHQFSNLEQNSFYFQLSKHIGIHHFLVPEDILQPFRDNDYESRGDFENTQINTGKGPYQIIRGSRSSSSNGSYIIDQVEIGWDMLDDLLFSALSLRKKSDKQSLNRYRYNHGVYVRTTPEFEDTDM